MKISFFVKESKILLFVGENFNIFPFAREFIIFPYFMSVYNFIYYNLSEKFPYAKCTLIILIIYWIKTSHVTLKWLINYEI